MLNCIKYPPDSEITNLPRRILVVDDEEAIRLLLKEYFEILGLEVCVTGCGQEGLKALSENRYRLVLCDVSMPGMDGFEFFEQARKTNPDQKVLFISGYAFADARKKILEKSLGLLKKPFHLNDLNQLLIHLFPDLL